MKNEGFKPPRYGLTVITPKNEGFGFPSYKDSYKKVGWVNSPFLGSQLLDPGTIWVLVPLHGIPGGKPQLLGRSQFLGEVDGNSARDGRRVKMMCP